MLDAGTWGWGVLGAADHPVVFLRAGLGFGGGGRPGRPVGVHTELLGQVHVTGLGSGVALATEPRQTPSPPVVPAHLGMCHSDDTGPRGRSHREANHRERSQIRYTILMPTHHQSSPNVSLANDTRDIMYTREHKGLKHKGDRQWSASWEKHRKNNDRK